MGLDDSSGSLPSQQRHTPPLASAGVASLKERSTSTYTNKELLMMSVCQNGPHITRPGGQLTTSITRKTRSWQTMHHLIVHQNDRAIHCPEYGRTPTSWEFYSAKLFSFNLPARRLEMRCQRNVHMKMQLYAPAKTFKIPT